jgi:DNA-binding transcriptional LysR family regulator
LYRSCSLTQVAVFEAVARLGSITRAAEEMCLAQPTVSLQMKRLSESLGVALYEINGRRLELTPAGREVLRACEEILERLAVMQARIATSPTGALAESPVLTPPEPSQIDIGRPGDLPRRPCPRGSRLRYRGPPRQ